MPLLFGTAFSLSNESQLWGDGRSRPSLVNCDLPLRRVQHAEGTSAIRRPNQNQRVSTFRRIRQFSLNVSCRMHRVTIYFRDDVTALQSGVIGRAAGNNALDHGPMNVARSLHLLPHVRRKVRQTDSPPWFSVLCAGGFGAFVASAHGLKRYRNLHALAIAHDREIKFAARLLLPNFHLEFTGIVDWLAIKIGDHVTDLQTRLFPRRIGFNLAHNRAGRSLHVEELRFVGRNVSNADTDVTMLDFAVLDQSSDGWANDLCGNGKSHAGKSASLRNQEGVDADDFPAGIHQRATRVSRVDGCIGLNELARGTAILGIWIRTIQGAHDSARHSEAKSERIAECQHTLSGVELSRVAPRDAG